MSNSSPETPPKASIRNPQVDSFIKLGYIGEVLPGEFDGYVLLENPQSKRYIRVYDNGDIWIFCNKSCSYIPIVRS